MKFSMANVGKKVWSVVKDGKVTDWWINEIDNENGIIGVFDGHRTTLRIPAEDWENFVGAAKPDAPAFGDLRAGDSFDRPSRLGRSHTWFIKIIDLPNELIRCTSEDGVHHLCIPEEDWPGDASDFRSTRAGKLYRVKDFNGSFKVPLQDNGPFLPNGSCGEWTVEVQLPEHDDKQIAALQAIEDKNYSDRQEAEKQKILESWRRPAELNRNGLCVMKNRV